MSHRYVCTRCGRTKTCAMAGCSGTCVKECVTCLRSAGSKDKATRLYNTRPLSVAQIRMLARMTARNAGLDANRAEMVAHRVVERMTPHETIADLIQRVIAEHLN